MIISVARLCTAFIKSGTGSDINLTAYDRMNAGGSGLFIKIDHAVHNAVVCDGDAVHSQLFDPGNQIFDLVGSVKQTVFRMYMQMCKFHGISPLSLRSQKTCCRCMVKNLPEKSAVANFPGRSVFRIIKKLRLSNARSRPYQAPCVPSK